MDDEVIREPVMRVEIGSDGRRRALLACGHRHLVSMRMVVNVGDVRRCEVCERRSPTRVWQQTTHPIQRYA